MLLTIIIILNGITFMFFGFDKWQAKMHKRRIPEFLLLSFSLIGGSCAALISMLLFRHKISKKSFLFKFGVIVFIQLTAIAYGLNHFR